MKKIIISLIFATFVMSSVAQNVIDLSGTWKFKLDSLDRGESQRWYAVTFDENITLPGTTDLAQKGVKNSLTLKLQKPQLSHLTRKHRYVGVAWYAKDVLVDKSWKGSKVTLELERVIWKTNVWVNGQKIAKSEESLVAPHRYEISEYLTPGAINKIVVSIDNRKQHDITVDDMAHAYTDHTQIMWNGVLGNITLTKHDAQDISSVHVYPASNRSSVDVAVELDNSKKKNVDFKISLINNASGKEVSSITEKRVLPIGKSKQQFSLKNLTSIEEWNEFNAALYTIAVSVGSQTKTAEFGFRHIEHDANRMKINGKPLFLRGTLDCCVFPLTGTPPTDRESWSKWFTTVKEWGMNHIRFHSWCPPSAAFEAADRLGLYLQIELPLWSTTIKKDSSLINFLRSEGDRIFEEYGNHPSFCLFTLGNELQSDFDVLGALLKDIRRNDGRQLYSTTSFTFEKGHGTKPETADDFFITQWTDKGWVRGQGVFNQQSPTFDKNFRASIEGLTVPLITHEIGQYSVYPDISEIKKYTGVLDPINFKSVEADLKSKGLIDKAPAYLMASGRLAALLYKEEIERALKTDGISGFQLLSLSDFPGQGTALVGLLNAFGESKGVTSAKEFSEAASPVTPLMLFPKATYTSDEQFMATVDVANYHLADIVSHDIEWSATDGNGVKLFSGNIPIKVVKQGYNSALGEISFPLSTISKATKIVLRVKIAGSTYLNSWSIWVYPSKLNMDLGKVKFTKDLAEAKRLLALGET
ncbi:MAG: glycoside hydrolase family 2, partial [Rikenellaceae bacterium]